MNTNCYMACIDLKDAYFSVPIPISHQKFLKFEWKNLSYRCTCFPNGLACCPRKFTKLMKPVFSNLRQLGHLPTNYIDDSCLIGRDWDDCERNVIDTVKILDTLGFVVHPHKSVLTPTQKFVYLFCLWRGVHVCEAHTRKSCQPYKRSYRLAIKQETSYKESS